MLLRGGRATVLQPAHTLLVVKLNPNVANTTNNGSIWCSMECTDAVRIVTLGAHFYFSASASMIKRISQMSD